MKAPQGFRFAAATAGLKASGSQDVAMAWCDTPLAWAATTTQNQLTAACVQRTRARAATGEPVYGIVVNSGNANCATGPNGDAADERMAFAAATATGRPTSDSMLTASTGVIGVPLPVEELVVPALEAVHNHASDDVDGFAQAILTTDLVTKTVEVTLPGGARVVGVAKGSGMIHPNMATMLAFVFTDAQVSQDTLRSVWPEIVAGTFNQVSVDGDMSPNDMAMVFASGKMAADLDDVKAALGDVAETLAKAIAADGEGAGTRLDVHVTGAATLQEARAAARAVAASSLVKTAVHGRDPNWGRVLSAVGQSGLAWDTNRLKVDVQGVTVFEGKPVPFHGMELATKMDRPVVKIQISIGVGDADAWAWGCDLSEGYVRINADYTT